jgi:hypothetical protein
MKCTTLLRIVKPLWWLVADRRIRLATAVVALACLASVAAVSPRQAPQPAQVQMRAGAILLAGQVGEQASPDSPPPRCGDIITTSVRLRTDLTCPADSNGLTIGADGITIDLNGHTITSGGGSLDTAGIQDGRGPDFRPYPSHRNVTIKNGKLHNFRRGVILSGSQATNLINIGVFGVSIPGSYRHGLDLYSTTGVTVQGGTIEIQTGFASIDGDFNSDLLISGILIIGTVPGPGADSVVSLGSNARLEHSTLVDVHLLLEDRTVIGNNQFTRSTVRTFIPADQHMLFNTTVIDNTFSGAHCTCLSGARRGTTNSTITILGGLNTAITGGEFSGNTFDGAAAAGVFIQVPTVTGMTISGNTFLNNGFGASGFGSSDLPLLDSNGSLVDDGLHITVSPGSDITVANNQTSRNADYGIEAIPGTVIDGGGNTSLNDPSGCLGVTCGQPLP